MLITLLCTAAGAGVLAAGGIIIETPAPYRVFQRSSAGSAAVPIAGTGHTTMARVEARVTSGPGNVISDWTALDVPAGNGTFEGRITLPAGGWYTIEVRGLDAQGEVAGEASVERVGVGEVFVCAGQSNAANAGETKTRAQSDLVAAFDGVNWSHCEDPQKGANGEGGSPWPTLGDLLARHLGVPVAFASVAVGGTSVNFWQPGAEGYAKLKRVMLALGTDGARAVLWHQGESDAAGGMPGADYEKKLENTIRSIRADAGYDIPWVVAKVSFVPDAWDNQPDKRDAIRSAQQALWDRGVALPGPDTDTMRSPELRAADRIHFSELGLRVHGERWFAAVWRGLFEGTAAGGL